MLTLLLPLLTLAAPLPDLPLTRSPLIITQSCRITIPPSAIIPDPNDKGVIQISASNITVEFADSATLRGAPAAAGPDALKGFAIRLSNCKNLTLRNLRLHAYWCALYAENCDNLTLDNIDASDNRCAHLSSTPAAEDESDWLSAHNNDHGEWLANYGAAIYVKNSTNVTIKNCKVAHGQNALCLDRVTDSKIFDNDFSFNSGWGLAMWRSSRNVISRNAIDFCVRGFSPGVYNRGQDSAGILLFEQNNDNVFAENSVTHGGDCFFGFAGREAIGETPVPPGFDYKRRGNNNNLLIKNDFSDSPCHGIEMTFSFANRFIANRIANNGICGVWAGFSQDTLIAENTFSNNGQLGYGLERGAINIEHGSHNSILSNTFQHNKCGIHLWSGPTDFNKKPWGKANGVESVDNLIVYNKFNGDDLAYHFRGPGQVTVHSNDLKNVQHEMLADSDHQVRTTGPYIIRGRPLPKYPVFGATHPVNARPALAGRESIVMTEWGPWDHVQPLVRLISDNGPHIYELWNMPSDLHIEAKGPHLTHKLDASTNGRPARLTIDAEGQGFFPYQLTIAAAGFHQEIRSTVQHVEWSATFFHWTDAADPRKDLQAWRNLALAPSATKVKLPRLSLKFGYSGPSDLHLSPALTTAKLPADHFGLIAKATVPLAKGPWKFSTLSDDGVRLSIANHLLIDNWTWHTPIRNEATYNSPGPTPVEITLEYFEIDGYATLDLTLTPPLFTP